MTATARKRVEERVNKPQRIQRKRVKGWKMPANTVYVGRPTIFGNPFHLLRGDSHEAKIAVEEYRNYLPGLLKAQPPELLSRIRGKNLACWCRLDQACHADVLLEIANGE